MFSALRRRAYQVLVPVAALMLVGCAGNGDDDVFVDEEEPVIQQRVGFPRDEVDSTGARARARVPASAIRLDDWDNDRMSYRPTSAGRIYILDDQYNVVYSGRIDSTQSFTFDRSTGRATIDGQTVFDRNLADTREFHVYYDRR